MDKFTLFELHVHDGMEFSATNTAPAIGRSGDDEEYEELAAYDDDTEYDADDADDSDADADSSGRTPSALTLFLGVVVLAVLAVAVRKFRSSDAELEVAELDDMMEAYDEEEEAEH